MRPKAFVLVLNIVIGIQDNALSLNFKSIVSSNVDLKVSIAEFSVIQGPAQKLRRTIIGRCCCVDCRLCNLTFSLYSLNDNIVRGAAKSLAPLPTAWIDNITGTTEVLARSLS